jgi:hypothetical protein
VLAARWIRASQPGLYDVICRVIKTQSLESNHTLWVLALLSTDSLTLMLVKEGRFHHEDSHRGWKNHSSSFFFKSFFL